MTIAFGVACEDGVLIATDSLTCRNLNGLPLRVTFDRKLRTLGERMPFVASGMVPDGYEPDPLWAALPLRDAAAAVFAELRWLEAHTEPLRGAMAGLEFGVDVLVAGGPRGERPGLLLVSSHPYATTTEVGGEPIVAGAMGHWAAGAVTFGPAPRTLTEAVPFALECCRRHLREQWHEWGFERLEDFTGIRGEPGGAIPPSAPPFRVVTITASDIQTMEVRE